MSGQNRNIGVFPSQEVSNEEKDSREYGLLVGRAIEQEWFKKDSGGVVRFQQNREEFHRLRKYARGEQSTKKYRDELSINGDLSYLNLDWKPVPILPKFVDILVNGMNSRLFDVSVNAIDELASKAKGKKRRELEDKMLTKGYMMKIEEQIGIDNSKSHAETPDNPEELDLHMQLNFKQGVEIAQEEALKYVFMKNDVDAILRKRLLLDTVVCGIAVAKHKYNEHSGITLEYVDPADMVFNYTDDPYFRDLYYWGEVKRVPIVELKKEHPWLTEEDLQMIVRTASDDRDYSSGRYSQQEENTDGLTVNVLYYNYKTYRTDVYKEKSTRSGGKKTTKRDSTFNPPKDKRTDFDRLEVVREVIYEGTKILGVEENLSNGGPVLSWGLMSNMVRPKGDGTKVLPNYCLHAPNVYKGRLEGIISRVTPYADMIQLQHLKLQQTVQRMTPDGVAIDVDSLAEIDLGNGTAYNPQEALRMYFQTGSVVMRTQAVDGTRNMNPNPIQPIQGHGSGDKISILVGTYNHYINIIRDVTGLNEAADGSSPSEYALPGVQKLAAANSNTATRHIQDGVNYIIKRLAVGAAGRIQDVIQHHPQKQSFIRAIGANNVASIEDIGNLPMHEFGIFITLHPDEEEKQMRENNIQVALSQNQINIDDAMAIRGTSNLKLANQLLTYRRKKKETRDQEVAQAGIAAQAEADAKKDEAMAQTAIYKEQAIAQAEITKMEAEHGFKLELLAEEVIAKKELMREEAMYKREIAQLSAQGAVNKFREGEQKKDDRLNRQNTQNSQMIEQRNTRGPARDFTNPVAPTGGGIGGGGGGFESSNDTLGSVGDLSEFDPR